MTRSRCSGAPSTASTASSTSPAQAHAGRSISSGRSPVDCVGRSGSRLPRGSSSWCSANRPSCCSAPVASHQREPLTSSAMSSGIGRSTRRWRTSSASASRRPSRRRWRVPARRRGTAGGPRRSRSRRKRSARPHPARRTRRSSPARRS